MNRKQVRASLQRMAFDAVSDMLGAPDRPAPFAGDVIEGTIAAIIDFVTKGSGRRAAYDIFQGVADGIAVEIASLKVVTSAGDPQP